MSDDEIQHEYTILERSKKNPGAFGELGYEKYFDRIFNFIYRQTDDEALTGDLCSQTFLNALKNLGRYEVQRCSLFGVVIQDHELQRGK